MSPKRKTQKKFQNPVPAYAASWAEVLIQLKKDIESLPTQRVIHLCREDINRLPALFKIFEGHKPVPILNPILDAILKNNADVKALQQVVEVHRNRLLDADREIVTNLRCLKTIFEIIERDIVRFRIFEGDLNRRYRDSLLEAFYFLMEAVSDKQLKFRLRKSIKHINIKGLTPRFFITVQSIFTDLLRFQNSRGDLVALFVATKSLQRDDLRDREAERLYDQALSKVYFALDQSLERIIQCYEKELIRSHAFEVFHDLEFAHRDIFKPLVQEEVKELLHRMLEVFIQHETITEEIAAQLRSIIRDNQYTQARQTFRSVLKDRAMLVNSRLTYEGLFYRLLVPLKEYAPKFIVSDLKISEESVATKDKFKA